MEDDLRKVSVWGSHGTLRQFYAEISAKAHALGYESELEGNTVRIFRLQKEGGFLGIGAKTSKQTVLEMIKDEDGTQIDESKADAEFVQLLASKLKQH